MKYRVKLGIPENITDIDEYPSITIENDVSCLSVSNITAPIKATRTPNNSKFY